MIVIVCTGPRSFRTCARAENNIIARDKITLIIIIVYGIVDNNYPLILVVVVVWLVTYYWGPNPQTPAEYSRREYGAWIINVTF